MKWNLGAISQYDKWPLLIPWCWNEQKVASLPNWQWPQWRSTAWRRRMQHCRRQSGDAAVPPPRWLLTPFTGRLINNLRKCSFIVLAFRQLVRAWSCLLRLQSIFLKMNAWKNGGTISWPLHLSSTLFFNPAALKLSVSAHSEVLIEKKKRKRKFTCSWNTHCNVYLANCSC